MKQTWPIYKTRLWLDRMNGELLTPKAYRIWLYIAERGPGGCDAWNWRIARDCKCSERTVTWTIKHLRKHSLIISSGDLGKFRLIAACLHPTKLQWRQIAVRNLMSLASPKMATIKGAYRNYKSLVAQRSDIDALFDQDHPRSKQRQDVALVEVSRLPG